MRKMKRLLGQKRTTAAGSLLLGIAIAVGSFYSTSNSHAQGTVTVTFEEPPVVQVGHGTSTNEYIELGMRFQPLYNAPFPNGVRRFHGPYAGFPDNGTTYFGGTSVNTNVLMFALVTGDLFSLQAVDLSHYAIGLPGPDTIEFIGHRTDGSVVLSDFTLEPLGPEGPVFQTFYFGSEFTDVQWVEIPVHDWWMDNLIFSTVPEPNAWALLLNGGILLWAMRRRKLPSSLVRSASAQPRTAVERRRTDRKL